MIVIGLGLGSLEGGVFVTLQATADLNDDNESDATGLPPAGDTRTEAERHDGKFHIDEFVTVLTTHPGHPLCLFDLGGSLSGGLNLKLKVIGATLLDERLTLFNENFNLGCPDEGGGLDGVKSDAARPEDGNA